MNQIGIAAVLVVAVGAALWFRRRPLTQVQRVVFALLAVGLMAVHFLREGHLHWGKVVLLVVGGAVLLAAIRFLGSADRGAE